MMLPRRKNRERTRKQQEERRAFVTARVISWFVLAFWLMLASLPVSFAQSGVGTIRGRVRDELGGLVASARVTAIDAEGSEHSSQTDERGEFVLDGLEPGLYRLRVSAQGFATYENALVRVAAG